MNRKHPQTFDGFREPRADFGAVQTGIQTLPHHIDIDLSIARGGSGALFLDIVGTDLLIDAASTGYANIEFQNGTFQSDAPIRVTPGFTASFEFTRLKITNGVQNGKFIRLIYGVDTKFSSGQVSIVSSANVRNAGIIYDPENSITGTDGYMGCVFYDGATVTNTAVELIAPSNNIGGIIVHRCDLMTVGAVAGNVAVVVSASPPASIGVGSFMPIVFDLGGAGATYTKKAMETSFAFAAGYGVYLITALTTTSSKVVMPFRYLR